MGYLDAYGAGVDRRLRTIKLALLIGLGLLLLATVLYFKFRDYPQHKQIDHFFTLLRAGDHQAAYALWGCTDAQPCRDYKFEKFMEDWGPKAIYGNPAGSEVVARYSCDTGVIETVRYPGKPDLHLWVERQTNHLSFAPWAVKEIPDDPRSRFAAWMWDLTRNCKPLIGP